MKKLLMSFFAGLMFFVMVGTVNATTIDTTSSWNGTTAISAFGEAPSGVADTYGQTFNLNAGDDNMLDSITFFVKDHSNPDEIDFSLHVYEWAGDRVTGSALFNSGVMTTNGSSIGGMEAFNINTGGVSLSTGTDYAWFISAAGHFDGLVGWGTVGIVIPSAYPNGSYITTHTGGNPSMWASAQWYPSIGYDLAFTMQLSSGAQPVPEPATIALLGIGLVGLGGRYFRKRIKGQK